MEHVFKNLENKDSTAPGAPIKIPAQKLRKMGLLGRTKLSKERVRLL